LGDPVLYPIYPALSFRPSHAAFNFGAFSVLAFGFDSFLSPIQLPLSVSFDFTQSWQFSAAARVLAGVFLWNPALRCAAVAVVLVCALVIYFPKFHSYFLFSLPAFFCVHRLVLEGKSNSNHFRIFLVIKSEIFATLLFSTFF